MCGWWGRSGLYLLPISPMSKMAPTTLFKMTQCSSLVLERKLSHGRSSQFQNHYDDWRSRALALMWSTNRALLSISATSKGGKDGENKIKSVLELSFPSATKLVVEDISGGCGSMYQVCIETKEFEGLSIVKQHGLVNKALKDEIKEMHGIRIQTTAPHKC